MEKRSIGTIKGESLKQDLTNAEDLSIEFSEGRNSYYHRVK